MTEPIFEPVDFEGIDIEGANKAFVEATAKYIARISELERHLEEIRIAYTKFSEATCDSDEGHALGELESALRK